MPILAKAVLGRKNGFYLESLFSEENPPIVPYSQPSRRLKYGPNVFRPIDLCNGSLDLPLKSVVSDVKINAFTPLEKGDREPDKFMGLLWNDVCNRKYTVGTYLLNAFIYAYCADKQIHSLDDKRVTASQVLSYMEDASTVAAKGICIWPLYASRENLLAATKSRINNLKTRKSVCPLSEKSSLFCTFDEKAAKEYSWNAPESRVGKEIATALDGGTMECICKAATIGMTAALFQKLTQYRVIYVRWSSENQETRKTRAGYSDFVALVESGTDHNQR
jgi:hypothetical protein